MHTLTITELQMKFAMLEDDLYQIQDMIEHDSTRWEIKHDTKYEEEIRNVLLQNEPDKTRNLAYVVPFIPICNLQDSYFKYHRLKYSRFSCIL
jgi:hypothetical protein